MKIKQIIGREIFDSRGIPALECDLHIQDEAGHMYSVRAAVPSGISTGKYEAIELRDGGKRLAGKGLNKAIENLQDVIGPAIIGKEPDIVTMDSKIIELDGTENKSKLGANATLAASFAILRAQALANEMEPYELIAGICGLDTIAIPIPMFNIINGGMHAPNELDFQEFMIIPAGQSNFRSAMESSLNVFYHLKAILQEKKLGTCIGDEGGFAPAIKDEKQALDLIMEAIEKSNNAEGSFVIGIDVAASRLYDPKTKKYIIGGKKYSSDQLLKHYEKLIGSYPIMNIEDGFAEDDWEGWSALAEKFGTEIQIVGDDLFTTNTARIFKGIEVQAANAALIKPNQIGTVTETLQAMLACKEHDLSTIMSHRSGETNDTIIVDLAIGTVAGQIKAGGLTRGERLAKYNRMLRIEDQLTMQVMNS